MYGYSVISHSLQWAYIDVYKRRHANTLWHSISCSSELTSSYIQNRCCIRRIAQRHPSVVSSATLLRIAVSVAWVVASDDVVAVSAARAGTRCHRTSLAFWSIRKTWKVFKVPTQGWEGRWLFAVWHGPRPCSFRFVHIDIVRIVRVSRRQFPHVFAWRCLDGMPWCKVVLMMTFSYNVRCWRSFWTETNHGGN